MSLVSLLLNGCDHKESTRRALARAAKYREKITEILNCPTSSKVQCIRVDPKDLWKDHMCSYVTVTLDQGTVWMGEKGDVKGFSSMSDGGGIIVGFPVCSSSHHECKDVMSSLNNPKNLAIIASHAVEQVKKASKDPLYPPMNGCLVTTVGDALAPGAKLSRECRLASWEHILSDPLRVHMASMLKNNFTRPIKGAPSCLMSLMGMDSGGVSYIRKCPMGKSDPRTCTGVRLGVQHCISPRDPNKFLCVLATSDKGVPPKVFCMQGILKQEDVLYKFAELAREECCCGPTKAVDVDTCRVSSMLSFHWMKMEGGKEIGMSVISMRHLSNRRDSVLGDELRIGEEGDNKSRKYSTDSPSITKAAMSDLFYILLTDGDTPYVGGDRDYRHELKDSFPPHLTSMSSSKVRDMSPATLTVMVKVGKEAGGPSGAWKPLWDSCGKAKEWMGKPALDLVRMAMPAGRATQVKIQSDTIHPRVSRDMVRGDMPEGSISSVFENGGCMDPCHLVNSCRVITVQEPGGSTEIYVAPHITRTSASVWGSGKVAVDTRKNTDFVTVLSTFDGADGCDKSLRCNVVHRSDATILNLLHSAAKTVTWGSSFYPKSIRSEHCYGVAADVYHIDCAGKEPFGSVQITMAVIAPMDAGADPTLNSPGTPFGSNSTFKKNFKTSGRASSRDSFKASKDSSRASSLDGVYKGRGKLNGNLLKLKELARWSGKPMKRYVAFGGATQIARDDAKAGCMWAKVVVSLADKDMEKCMYHANEIRSLISNAKDIDERSIDEAGRYIAIINSAVQDKMACASVLQHV